MLSKPCEILAGIGPALTSRLAQCGLITVCDLLFHLPFRYQDQTRVTAIRDLRANDYAVVIGQVCQTQWSTGRKPTFTCFIEDKTGLLRLRFFHMRREQSDALKEGQWIRAFGEVRAFGMPWEMVHPQYQLLSGEENCQVQEHLTPIYSTTQGLTQTRLRQCIQTALQKTRSELVASEWLTPQALANHGFPSLWDALSFLHAPSPEASVVALEQRVHPAFKRLALDEFIAHQVSMRFAREKRKIHSAPALLPDSTLPAQFHQQLSFTLTNAQVRVGQEIQADLKKNTPMLRLVQGDVGSGKTVIAALAALQAIACGYQVALMAPTELLSEQHALQFEKWLTPLGICCLRLSGSLRVRARRETLKRLADNTCSLLIGTHALFQQDVVFANLGLIIIDEQHRFGVEQRLLLHQKGAQANTVPHQLLMTATPIPRTLAMAQWAHVELSTLDELPPGRTPVHTVVLNQEKRDQVVERLSVAIAEGRQAYWVCPLIEESEKLDATAALAAFEQLKHQLPTVRIGLVHGRMKSLEKETTMQAFKAGELDLLVATTVIEVGVDVPRASLMIIENAERLGLSQLHQLRGRVGRGSTQSHCLLLYQTPLSSISAQRLRILRETNDGFLIAEHDLTLRGAGELLGSRQTGHRSYKIADLGRDNSLLPLARNYAKQLLTTNPQQANQIARRWLGEFEGFLQG